MLDDTLDVFAFHGVGGILEETKYFKFVPGVTRYWEDSREEFIKKRFPQRSSWIAEDGLG